MGNLTALRHLNLYGNELTGPIPATLTNLTKLGHLNLGFNALTGRIPATVGNLTNLTALYLASNDLTGQIPATVGNLTNLTALSMASNDLTGQIPPELGNLTNLNALYLDNNDLTGQIPPELGNLSSLNSLVLNDNDLTGPIPAELGNLFNLISLYLDDNDLTGQIPAELGNLTLLILTLLGNVLTGCYPANFIGFTGTTHTINPQQRNLSLNPCSGIAISSIRVSVPEGGTANYYLRLSSIPTADVTITITASGNSDSDITVDTDTDTSGNQNTITLDHSSWSTEQQITLAANDDVDLVHGVAILTHTSSSTDTNYNGLTPTIAAREADKGPYIEAHDITHNSAAIVITGHSGEWWLKRTAPTTGTCISAGTATQNTVSAKNVTGLTAAQDHQYIAYSNSTCSTTIDSITFTTSDPPFTATGITHNSATLTLTGHSGNWWLKRTKPTGVSTCSSKGSTYTANLTGLNTNTTYTYTAHSGSGCTTSNTINTVSFTTNAAAPPLTATGITHNSATLTLTGHPGSWWLKRTTPTDTTCKSKGTTYTENLTSLTAALSYTYTAYSDSTCSTTINTVTFTTTEAPELASTNITHKSATLTLTNHPGSWWLKRTTPTDTTCKSKGTTYTENLTSLTAALAYTYTAYSDSTCSTTIDTVTFATAAAPTLTASNTTFNSSTLILIGHVGAWWLKRTAPTGDTTCKSKSSAYSENLTSLDASTTYTYTAYSNSGCSTSINDVTFTTTATPPLTATNIAHNSATLTLINYSGNWWLKRTSPDPNNNNTCKSKGTTYTENLTGLTAAQTYTYTAYSNSTCSNTINAVTFTTTTTPPLTATSIIHNSATLTLINYSGNWWLKRTTPADTTCKSKGTTYTENLTGLTAAQTYTYTAYSNSTCSNTINAVTFTTTTTPPLTATNIAHNSAMLTLVNYSGNWWLKRTTPADTTCKSKGTTYTEDLTGLNASTTYTYTAYSNSACSTSIKDVTFTTTAAPPLTATSITFNTATLTLTGHSGNWWLKRTTPADTTCKSKGTTYTEDLTTLNASTTYTYTAYTNSACTTTINAVTFTTPTPTLITTSITHNTANLTLIGHSGNWWLKRTTPADTTCKSKGTTYTEDLTTLNASTTYTYTAYSNSGCSTSINAVTFTTTAEASPLTASSVTHNSATLTLTGQSGNWWLKRTTPTSTTCKSKSTTYTENLTGLNTSTTYTYTAYSNSGCSTSINAVTFTTTAKPPFTATSIAHNSATLTLVNYSGNWWLKRTSPDPNNNNTCTSKGTTYTEDLTGLNASTTYTYTAYSNSGCSTSINAVTFTTTAKPPFTATSIAHNSATLTLVNYSSNWWLKRTKPTGDNTCKSKGTTYTEDLIRLTAALTHTYTAYTDSGCSDAINAVTFTTIAKPPLTAVGITHNSATLTLTNYSGNWWLKRTSPDPNNNNTCKSKNKTYTEDLASLNASRTYTYTAYTDNKCTTIINSVTFTAAAIPPLTAASITHNSATLTLANYSGNWWLKRTKPADTNNSCKAKNKIYTDDLTTLTSARTYTYTAYTDNTCSNAINAITFTTIATPTLAATSITHNSATLTLTNYSGNWWLKRTTPTSTTCKAKNKIYTENLTSLDASLTYTYTAYTDNGCTNTINAATFTTTATPILIAANVTHNSATLTLVGHSNVWSIKRTSPDPDDDNPCKSKGTTYTENLTSLDASQTYTYTAYTDNICNTTIINFIFTTTAAPAQVHPPIRTTPTYTRPRKTTMSLKDYFIDDNGHIFETYINKIAANEITLGCSYIVRFCPNDVVTRAQMATLITRALKLPAPGNIRIFNDTTTHTHRKHISTIIYADIAYGCDDDNNFCPDHPVTRAQMAAFLTRAFKLPRPSSIRSFNDTATHSHGIYIATITAAGITKGCKGGSMFCPEQHVTRGQMAAFLVRALKL